MKIFDEITKVEIAKTPDELLEDGLGQLILVDSMHARLEGRDQYWKYHKYTDKELKDIKKFEALTNDSITVDDLTDDSTDLAQNVSDIGDGVAELADLLAAIDERLSAIENSKGE